MSHQPFEDWILDDEDLDEGQRQALVGHLAGCRECARLNQSLAAVDKRCLQVNHPDLALGTGYVLKAFKGLRSADGQTLASDTSSHFRTAAQWTDITKGLGGVRPLE